MKDTKTLPFKVLVPFAGAALTPLIPAHAGTVTVAFESAQQDQVAAAIDELVVNQPNLAEGLFTQVIGYYEQHYPQEADYRCADTPQQAQALAEHLRKAPAQGDYVILGPGWCIALWGKGYALIDLNRSGEAEPLLAKAVAMAPDDAHYRNEYAELFKSRREWQRSYLEFSLAWDVVSHDPKGPHSKVAARALRGMGYNKIELGDLDEAERLFRQSLEFDPGNPGANNELEYIARLRASGARN